MWSSLSAVDVSAYAWLCCQQGSNTAVCLQMKEHKERECPKRVIHCPMGCSDQVREPNLPMAQSPAADRHVPTIHVTTEMDRHTPFIDVTIEMDRHTPMIDVTIAMDRHIYNHYRCNHRNGQTYTHYRCNHRNGQTHTHYRCHHWNGQTYIHPL